MIGLFCRMLSLSWGSFAKETYNFKEPTSSVVSTTHYNALQYMQKIDLPIYKRDLYIHERDLSEHKIDQLVRHTTTHCNTLQHTTTHCNTLQHTATHYNTLQHTATHCNTLQHTTATDASHLASSDTLTQ